MDFNTTPPLQCPSDPIGVDNSGVKYEPNWSFLVHVQAWPGQIRQQDTLMDTEFISSKNSTMKQSFFLWPKNTNSRSTNKEQKLMSSFHVLAWLIQVREERAERHLMGQFPICWSLWGSFQLCQLAGMKENTMYFLSCMYLSFQQVHQD